MKKDEPPLEMVVRRGHVLEDALRRADQSSFDPCREIVVCYAFSPFTISDNIAT